MCVSGGEGQGESAPYPTFFTEVHRSVGNNWKATALTQVPHVAGRALRCCESGDGLNHPWGVQMGFHICGPPTLPVLGFVEVPLSNNSYV